MNENRIAERTRTFLKGRIEYNNGQASMECLIRDLSETGARVAVSDSVTLPDHFRLFIPKTNRWMNAQTRWRRGGLIGISFVTDTVEVPIAADGDTRTRELETEVRRLRLLLESIRNDPSRIQVLLDEAI